MWRKDLLFWPTDSGGAWLASTHYDGDWWTNDTLRVRSSRRWYRRVYRRYHIFDPATHLGRPVSKVFLYLLIVLMMITALAIAGINALIELA